MSDTLTIKNSNPSTFPVTLEKDQFNQAALDDETDTACDC